MKIRKIKLTINVIFAAIPLAMGVAVTVLSTIDDDISVNQLVKMLGIAVAALGILALGNITEREKNRE